MRQYIKWTIFIVFWFIFCSSSLHLMYASINHIFGQNFISVFESCSVAIGLVLFLISFSYNLCIVSPRLGMKVVHDTGTYFVDLHVEHFNRMEPKTNLLIYKDKTFWKKRISFSTISNDFTELDLANEINKVLLYRKKELELNKKIKQTTKNTLNLLSVESRRDEKIKSIF